MSAAAPACLLALSLLCASARPGQLQDEEGELARALESRDRAERYRAISAFLERHPSSAKGHYQLGYLLRNAGDTDGAERELAGILGDPDTTPEGGYYLAEIRMVRGDLRGADQALARAREATVALSRSARAAPSMKRWAGEHLVRIRAAREQLEAELSRCEEVAAAQRTAWLTGLGALLVYAGIILCAARRMRRGGGRRQTC